MCVRTVLVGFKKVLVALNHCRPVWAEPCESLHQSNFSCQTFYVGSRKDSWFLLFSQYNKLCHHIFFALKVINLHMCNSTLYWGSQEPKPTVLSKFSKKRGCNPHSIICCAKNVNYRKSGKIRCQNIFVAGCIEEN